MTAVKVQPSVTAKSDLVKGRGSEQTSVQRDDFTKLLQAKKDGAQQSGKTESKKPETQKADGTGSDDKKVGDGQDTGQEETQSLKDGQEEMLASEEALQQAALQQAAAQMLIQTDEAELVQETAAVVEGVTEAAGSSEMAEIASEVMAQDDGAAQVRQAAAEPVKAVEPKEEKVTAQPVMEKPVQQEEPEKVVQTQERSDSGRHTETQGKPETQQQTAAEGADDRRVRQDSDSRTVDQNQVYSTEVRSSNQVQETAFGQQRTEQIPLKTTPQQLPEDLGKTLASKVLDTARTLTVELEPAALGKLTIRLVYEGDRASLSIMASNPRTLDILSERASEIAAILEEKTGQETIIYTQPAETGRDPYEEEQNQNRGGEQEEQQQQQNRGEEQHQTESFAQQLRLGLV